MQQSNEYLELYTMVPPKAGMSRGVIAGISVAGVAGTLILAFCVYAGFYRRKKVVEASLLKAPSEDPYIQLTHGDLSI